MPTDPFPVQDKTLYDRVVLKQEQWAQEVAGLVESPLPSDMLQPWEVWDQDLFDLEMVRVFGRSWVWLGDTEDLQKPGDYITGRIGYQSIVVIRQDDGSVKGFLNNCRHRASGLAFESAGYCGKALACPYHAWTYGIDGRLLSIPDMDRMYGPDFPKEQYGLVPIRIKIAFGKLVFGCLSRRAPSFDEWIAPILPRYLQYRIHEYRRYQGELNQVYNMNWKVFVENSNDDFHVRFVHRRLNKVRKQLDTVVRFEGRITSGYKPHADKFDMSLGRTDLDPMDLRGSYAEFVYPNLTPLPYAAQLILVRADPITPSTTRLVSRIYGLSDDPQLQARELEGLAQTNKEDTDMVTILMENLRSPFYRVGPPSMWEGRAQHMMRLIRQDASTPLASDEFAGPVEND